MFKDREDAGRQLADEILKRGIHHPILLALPRGGVSVAHEAARKLKTAFDVVVARKIGAPGQPEFGIGAISEESTATFNPGASHSFDLEGKEVRETIERESQELQRRLSHYRHGRKLPVLEGETVILIDDGLATGATARAAGLFLKTKNPKRLILAVPVVPADIDPSLEEIYDEIICLKKPSEFRAVGLFYDDFSQVEDAEVLSILRQHHPVIRHS